MIAGGLAFEDQVVSVYEQVGSKERISFAWGRSKDRLRQVRGYTAWSNRNAGSIFSFL